MRRPDTTTIYAVYWAPDEGDDLGVLKVGIEKGDRRHRMWVRRGAVLAALFVEVPKAWERRAHARLAERFPRAFDSEGDAKWLLGHGYGHTECFIVAPHERVEALQLVAAAIGGHTE